MSRRFDTISFLSDYGLADEFAGVCSAVMRDIAPHVSIVNLTHSIPAFDVRAGALALARSVAYLPEGVILAVVDPGVGTDRKAIAVEVAGGAGIFVAPDNGLIAPAVAIAGGAERAFQITNQDVILAGAGGTFDGRDVFAPAAAQLCNGFPLEELGPELDTSLLMPSAIPLPREENDTVIAEVLWVDHFGNCQLNVGPDDLSAGWGPVISLTLPDPVEPGVTVVRSAQMATSFGSIGGGIGLVVDSLGMYAVCLDRRSAAGELALDVGDQVVIAEGEAELVTTPVTFGR